jgi:ornithine cyclodeaminase
LRAAIAAGLLAPGTTPPELGQVIAGLHPGRESQGQVTICDLTGTGAQDTAIATHALKAARAAGAGTVIRA